MKEATKEIFDSVEPLCGRNGMNNGIRDVCAVIVDEPESCYMESCSVVAENKIENQANDEEGCDGWKEFLVCYEGCCGEDGMKEVTKNVFDSMEPLCGSNGINNGIRDVCAE